MIATLLLPDGTEIAAQDILYGKLPASLPTPASYLRKIVVSEREWNGTPSTTMLLNGLRETYLKLTEDYAVDVDSIIFALMGTAAHHVLEGMASDDALTEVKWDLGWITGIADLVEKQPSGERFLIDFKFQGAYAIRKFLGLVKKDEPLFENGMPVLYKTGKKAGEQKTYSVWTVDPKQADTREKALQLNMYRIGIEKSLNIDIARMKIFFMARDGMRGASMNGMNKLTYYPDVPYIDDDEVWKYFHTRAETLKDHLSSKVIPSPCSKDEAWGGRKCAEYCPVAQQCVARGDNPYITADQIASKDKDLSF